jgi:8-amino-7-oxononanoate synthase
MDGDIAPLSDLVDLAKQHECELLVDEAHATGVLGEQGRGALESLPADNCVKIGTLSKALGAQGGFVCGSRSLISWLINRARPYIFSTALAPPLAAAARRGVAIVAAEPDRRRRLLAFADLLREQLRSAGIGDTGSCSQIVPLVIGEAADAMRLSRLLEERGLFVPAIRPPSVPDGTARLRISLTAAHSKEDVIRLVEALQQCQIPMRGRRHAHG